MVSMPCDGLGLATGIHQSSLLGATRKTGARGKECEGRKSEREGKSVRGGEGRVRGEGKGE